MTWNKKALLKNAVHPPKPLDFAEAIEFSLIAAGIDASKALEAKEMWKLIERYNFELRFK